ncbi:MAG: hypothetical protein HY301_15845 [Verrucomicrobia bacterium]|nr:hypothetical protein [Verrucomicrobiota bacterium]
MMRPLRFSITLLSGLLLLAALRGLAAPADYFEIRVVDEATGRGVPLVELETVNHLLFVTDSAGRVAFHEPGLMSRAVYFHVRSHGYEMSKDGFGYIGKALDVKPGGSATIKLKRVNLAERLYRITGEGIYRDTVLLGHTPPIAEPLLNAQVVGQDTVETAVYRGKIFWFWGDTMRARYPLGHYQTSGATSELPGHGGLDPAVGVNLTYFKDAEGFSKRMVPFKAEGPIWIDGLLTVADAAGRERLVAHYSRMKSLGERLEHGLVIYNDEREEFEKVAQFDLNDDWRCPRGHPVRVHEEGGDYFLFPAPFANVRVRATLEDLKTPASYEGFTCVAGSAKFSAKSAKPDLGADGRPRWSWKKGAEPVGAKEELALIGAGKLKASEARWQLSDPDSGKPVAIHASGVNWNAFRKQWILIGQQLFGGPSFGGEIWFAEADAPTGPWRNPHRIVTHQRYTFYNPAQHAFLDAAGGRFIFFEGTYTQEFSGNAVHTPRYDYNQIMYRLDLADPRLKARP